MIAPAMTANAQHFYITGGTLPRDAVSYVVRQADADLLEGLRQGQFCYILTSRQMGKSSLMVQTAQHLRQEGVAVAVLDLTAVGQTLTSEQWYDGLLHLLARALDLEDEMNHFWLAHERLGPLQRWALALRDVVLAKLPGRITIFVDEIDVVRSLPFSADDFFAAIRECYNRRSEDAEFTRLNFCLLGVATPSDLIRDTRITPFNIGKRIELTDFTPEEAAPLGEGLNHRGTGSPLLQRVLYWTGGHPYLTQRLCQAVAETGGRTATDVDRLCETLFLSQGAQEQDDNLIFVRERLIRSEVDLNNLLDLYRRIRSGKAVSYDETDPLYSILRLSGVAAVSRGLLCLRNRVYAQVFDQSWVRQYTSAAEKRRQQAAYRQGLLRAAGIAGVILLAMGGLTGFAIHSANRAAKASGQALQSAAKEKAARGDADTKTRAALEAARREAEAHKAETRARRLAQDKSSAAIEAARLEMIARSAETQAKTDALDKASLAQRREGEVKQERDKSDSLLYIADMNLIQTAYDKDDFGRVQELLAETSSNKSRNFEWGYWNRLAHLDLMTLKGHTNGVTSVAFSPNGKYIVTGSGDSTVKLWDAKTGKKIRTFKGHSSGVTSVAFSPNGKYIVTGSCDSTARVWDVSTGSELLPLKGHTDYVFCVTFSPDGQHIVTGSNDHTARVWDARTGREMLLLKGHTDGIVSIAFSPDGKRIITGSFDSTAKLWDAETGKEINTFRGHGNTVTSVAFSPDGKRIVTSSADKISKLWNAETGKEINTFTGHEAPISSLAFSPDGKRIITGSYDRTAKLWDTETGQAINTFRGHMAYVVSVSFSPNGKRIVTGSYDHTAQVWDVERGRETLILKGHQGYFRCVAFSPDGKRIVTSANNRVWIWFSDETDTPPTWRHVSDPDSERSWEAESLTILNMQDGVARRQNMSGFGPHWSDDAHLFFNGAKPGAEVTLELPVAKTGKYTLSASFTAAPDFAIVQALVDGKAVGIATDNYSNRVLLKGKTALGVIFLTSGSHRLTFRVTGKNTASTGYFVGVDTIELEPVPIRPNRR